MPLNELVEKYDIYFTKATSQGCMLAEDKTGVKIWERTDNKSIPDSLATSEMAYALQSPEVERTIEQLYFHGGIGSKVFENPLDFNFASISVLKTENVDTRCAGKVYAAPKQSTMAKVAFPGTLIDGGFEIWTDATHLTNWTWGNLTGTPDLAQDSTDVRTGTYSAEIVLAAAENGDLVQTFTWNNNYRSKVVNAEVYAYRTAGVDGHVKITIVDDVGSTPGTEVALAGAAYEKATCAHTIAANATSLEVRVEVRAVGGNTWVSIDDFRIDLPSNGSVLKTVRFNDIDYIAEGNNLQKNSAGTISYVESFLEDITDLAVWGDYLFIALGDSADVKYQYMDVDEAFTASNLAAGKGEATLFTTVGATMWKVILPNSARSSTNPINGGDWSAATTVGGGDADVKKLLAYQALPYFLKENGVYYISGGVVYHPFESLESSTIARGGVNADVFRDRLYLPMGAMQEWEVNGSAIAEVTPGLFAPDFAHYQYAIDARAHDESWLYSIMDRGASSLGVLASRNETILGSARYPIHDFVKVTAIASCSFAWVSSVEGRPYLYLGSGTSTDSVAKIYLPETNDATQDSGYKFTTTTGYLWTSRYATRLTVASKRWKSMVARQYNMNADRKITVTQSTDDGANFAALGVLNTGTEQTLTYSSIDGSMMNLLLAFATNSETSVPELKDFFLKATVVMASTVKFNFTIKSADNQLGKKNVQTNNSMSTLATFINTIRDAIAVLGDREGTEHTVRVRVAREYDGLDFETKRPVRLYDIEALKL